MLWTILIIFTYSISCSVDPQYLHSFPTRRSSDLIDQPVAIRIADEIAVRAERLLRVKPVVADIVFNQHREAVSGSTDRKSTRLNSSHLGISYAVFCLKIKI